MLPLPFLRIAILTLYYVLLSLHCVDDFASYSQRKQVHQEGNLSHQLLTYKLTNLPTYAQYHVFFLFFFKLIYLFLAALGLPCCVRAFSSCGEQGLLFIAVRRLLLLRSSGSTRTGFSSCGTQASVVVARGL